MKHAIERLSNGGLLTHQDLQLHFNRYRFGLRYAQGNQILDVACGIGYGTELISSEGSETVGGDIDRRTLNIARKEYGTQAQFVLLDACTLPFRSASFDIVISLETIEHLSCPHEFIDECCRVLGENGVFVCSTPNRMWSSPGRSGPQNPHHEREYTVQEFSDLLRSIFGETELYGQGIANAASFFRRRVFDIAESLLRRLPQLVQEPTRRMLRHALPPDYRLEALPATARNYPIDDRHSVKPIDDFHGDEMPMVLVSVSRKLPSHKLTI